MLWIELMSLSAPAWVEGLFSGPYTGCWRETNVSTSVITWDICCCCFTVWTKQLAFQIGLLLHWRGWRRYCESWRRSQGGTLLVGLAVGKPTTGLPRRMHRVRRVRHRTKTSLNTDQKHIGQVPSTCYSSGNIFKRESIRTTSPTGCAAELLCLVFLFNVVTWWWSIEAPLLSTKVKEPNRHKGLAQVKAYKHNATSD